MKPLFLLLRQFHRFSQCVLPDVFPGNVCRFWACLLAVAPVFVSAQPVEVIPPELAGANQPQVAVDPDQKIYVVFGKGDRIYCAASVDGARTFLPPREVAKVPRLALGMRRGPRIVASAGRITVSAVSQQTGDLYAWTSGDGGRSWTQGATINSVSHAAREGLIGMAGDQQGNVYVVWLDGRNNGAQLWGAASRDDGRTWGSNVEIYQSPDGHICECCHPSVEVATNGFVRVMWRNWRGGSRDLYTAISTDNGKTFGRATKLGSGTWPLNACPMDGGGLAGPYSVWRRGSEVYYTYGNSVEHPLGAGRQPVVCLGQSGPYFIWEQSHQLLLQKGSHAPMVLSQSGTYPSIAAASADQAPIAVWESAVNGAPTILAQVLK